MDKKIHLYFIALSAAISGIIFGYDAGIISGAILFIEKNFLISSYQMGLIVSAVPIGAIFSAASIGKLSDAIGRKKILIFTAIIFALGSLFCASATQIFELVLGRLFLGVAIGMCSSAAPMYIAEIAEEKLRGKLVTLFLIAVNGGLFISYATNYILAPHDAWREMLALGAVPAALLLLCAFFLPESPRWLMLKGKAQQALSILNKIHGEHAAAKEMQEIRAVVQQEQLSLKKIINSRYFKVIILGVLISVFTQAVGINILIYYAPTIFQKAGFSEATVSILATMGIGFTVTIAAIIAALFIDKVGRRKLLLIGLSGIILSLIIMCYAFHSIQNQHILGWTILVSSIFFVACQGLSVGPACFLLPSEIFPAKIRSYGIGISIAFNWITNSVIVFTFPVILNKYGAAFSFGLFVILSSIGWLLFYYFVPETKHVSLEKIEMNVLAGKSLRDIGEERILKRSFAHVRNTLPDGDS